MRSNATFADLFCGGGLATAGLVESGMQQALGIDADPVAIESYRSNGWRAHCVDARDVMALFQPNMVDFVWLSPPCTEFSSGSNHRTKKAEVIELVSVGIETAAHLARHAFVAENHDKMIQSDAFVRGVELARKAGFEHVQTEIIDAANVGGASHRKRVFAVFSRKPVATDSLHRFVLSRERSGRPVLQSIPDAFHKANRDWRNTGAHAARIAEHAAKGRNKDGFIYGYYSSPVSSPARTVTTVPRMLLCLPDFRRYWLKSDDYRELMDVPSWMKISGTERQKCKIIGNGVNPLVAKILGDYLQQTFL